MTCLLRKADAKNIGFFICAYLPNLTVLNFLLMDSQKDDQLWRIARKRADFKKSLFSYLIVIAFLWGIWWFTSGQVDGFHGYPWPIWVMLGWGLGLGFQYFDAYNGSRQNLTEKEYEKLKREQEK